MPIDFIEDIVDAHPSAAPAPRFLATKDTYIFFIVDIGAGLNYAADNWLANVQAAIALVSTDLANEVYETAALTTSRVSTITFQVNTQEQWLTWLTYPFTNSGITNTMIVYLSNEANPNYHTQGDFATTNPTSEPTTDYITDYNAFITIRDTNYTFFYAAINHVLYNNEAQIILNLRQQYFRRHLVNAIGGLQDTTVAGYPINYTAYNGLSSRNVRAALDTPIIGATASQLYYIIKNQLQSNFWYP